ncbi:MAG: futalosine hydrolase [Planctomycetota bacterium]|jgi:futalosine hydrolase
MVVDGTTKTDSTLVLVPTRFEMDHIDAIGPIRHNGATVEVCGFGAVAAAARTAQLIARHRPGRVLLIGIAGAYNPHALPIGAAACFGAVTCHGVGKGGETNFLNPTQMGFPQWAGDALNPPVFETLPLHTPPVATSHPNLLSVTASSDSQHLADARRQRYRADAEDMEGFGVALAGVICGTPVAIARGISNVVGQRDPRSWKIQPAIEAVRALALDILNDPQPWEPNT